MGRKASSLKNKGTAAVPLPHDGPIHYSLQATQAGEQVCTHEGEDFEQALALLNASEELRNSDSKEIEDLTLALCHSLRNATGSKEQLHSLQSYRSTLLNLRQKESTETLEYQTCLLGLYRLLLEWSLSLKTPVPLQRVIQSNLQYLDIPQHLKEDIATRVLASIWKQGSLSDSAKDWANPIHSLDVAINAPQSVVILKTSQFSNCLTFLRSFWINGILNKASTDLSGRELVEEGLTIAGILKIMLHPGNRKDQPVIPFVEDFEMAIMQLMKSPSMPTEGHSTLGIVYGRLKFHSHLLSENPRPASGTALQLIGYAISEKTQMSALARVSVVQGVAATLEADSLIARPNGEGSTTPLEACWEYTLKASHEETDPIVRWASLKGLSTLASRWRNGQNELECLATKRRIDCLIQETLQVVLQAWENPPLRKVGTAIPGIFRILVELLPEERLLDLCDKVMAQPVSRKGRYLALEALIPYMQTEKIIVQIPSLLDGIGDRGPNAGAIADLWAKLLSHTWETEPSVASWSSHWVPSLARALLEGELQRRRQISSFCLVRIVDILKSAEGLQEVKSAILSNLFVCVSTAQTGLPDPTSSDGWGTDDRVLWAQLELSRQYFIHKSLSPKISERIRKFVPLRRVETALVHSIDSIRLVGFQSLEAILSDDPDAVIQTEAQLWKSSLYLSMQNSDNKEFVSSLLQSLMIYLDRFSVTESVIGSPDRFEKFVIDFLLQNIALAHGVYPGTTAAKEGFSLTLLEKLLAFVLQNKAFSIDMGGSKSTLILNRKRNSNEKETMSVILVSMISQEVFAAMFSLLHSIWDSTRTHAFQFLSKLVIAAQMNDIPIPTAFRNSARGTFARGSYLASSPRQREADTGARMLAFLYSGRCDQSTRLEFLSEIVSILETRLAAMKVSLRQVVEGSGVGATVTFELPLAHGLVRSILLMIQHENLEVQLGHTRHVNSTEEVSIGLASIFRQAIELSLTIVADVREGEVLEGMDESLLEVQERAQSPQKAAPLNVNTGAIGANGTFSKLSSGGNSEMSSKLAVQRIVIGTWLLTKEACAALSATIAIDTFDPPVELVEKCGASLISTLASLKHAGAAFASRDSLQEIATTCYRSRNETLRSIPLMWARRLLVEISSMDKVRDSTLRRSTGYALGFLALLRSEVVARSPEKTLCKEVLTELVKFSLPSKRDTRNRLGELGFELGGNFGFSTIDSEARSYAKEASHESRCRVHALNILRLIVLDAPLTSVATPYIGDAMISALLGYNDGSWAVRNSSTMVFAAAMLRVVDSDKNASNNDKTSSQAITVTELFRRYPSLAKFLPAIMRKCFEDDKSSEENSPIFPILLLLSRIQPVAKSGGTAIALTEEYSALVFGALRNRNHAIREAGARAIANLCSEDPGSTSGALSCVDKCIEVVRSVLERKTKNWNLVHGALASLQCFLFSSPSAKKKLRNPAVQRILEDACHIGENGCRMPPSCISFAFNILKATSNDLRRVAQEIMLTCTRATYLKDMAGGTYAFAAASEGIVAAIQVDLWNPSSVNVFEDAVSILGDILSSDLIDVRLPAAKAFKKSIYHAIDNLNTQGMVSASDVLTRTAQVCLTSAKKELSRSHFEDAVGPHPPTVRRLSRCFLECFDGCTDHVDFLRSRSSEMWKIALEMLEHENFIAFMSGGGANGETFLAGNAVEIMSIVISHTDENDAPYTAYTKKFVGVVRLLNSHDASWRSRYSAAKSVQTSGLNLTPESGNRELLSIVIEMLQDSDPDVRRCAARTAVKVISTSDQDEVSSLLPHSILRDIYSSAYGIGIAGNSVSHLLDSVLVNCAPVLKSIESIDSEMEKSRTVQDASDIGNYSTSRQIFEHEDPNPYKESALIVQIALQLLLTSKENASVPEEQSNEISLLLLEVLRRIQQTCGSGNILHDLSRMPEVFSSLHGLLCGFGTCLYLGLIDANQETTATVLELSKEIASADDESILHPEIYQLLSLLPQIKRNDETSKHALRQRLFLLVGQQ